MDCKSQTLKGFPRFTRIRSAMKRAEKGKEQIQELVFAVRKADEKEMVAWVGFMGWDVLEVGESGDKDGNPNVVIEKVLHV